MGASIAHINYDVLGDGDVAAPVCGVPECFLDRFALVRQDRCRRGGGIGIYLSENLMYSKPLGSSSKNLEQLGVSGCLWNGDWYRV